MSELKWNWVYYPYLDAPNEQEESALKAGYIKVVDKSEADKVIADRDDEIKKLKDSIDRLLKAKTEQIIHEIMRKTLIYGEGFIRVEDAMKLIAELRHANYKRCLKNREICVMRCDIEFARQYPTRAGFFVKWERKWLEFAEKFKEAK